MKFSVVETGYDRAQVDSYLAVLDEQVGRLIDRAASAQDAQTALADVRTEANRLRWLLTGADASSNALAGRVPADAVDRRAAAILARAREELAAAREEARLIRDRAYAEALQARREFEAALHTRRLREERVDEILRAVSARASSDGEAGSAVPATRAAAGDPAQQAR